MEPGLQADRCFELLQSFEFKNVLQEDTRSKKISLLGVRTTDNQPMVIDLEWNPFSANQDQDNTLKDLLNFIQHSLPVSSIEPVFQNDIWYGCIMKLQSGNMSFETGIRCDIIYPATQSDIVKRTRQDRAMIQETWETYVSKVRPFIQEIPKTHVQWVEQIINGTAEQDQIYLRRYLDKNGNVHDTSIRPDSSGNGYIILPDSKWDRKSISTLYLLVIFFEWDYRSDPNGQDGTYSYNPLYTIRDLRFPMHINLLESCKKDIQSVLNDAFQLSYSQVRAYFHYPPTFYWLHLHVTHLDLEPPGAIIGKAHLLEDIMDSMVLLYPEQYFQKKTFSYVIGARSSLWAACFEDDQV
jgi:m7GpppX diphosphatase